MFTRRWLINYLLLVLIIIFTWIGKRYPITEDQKFDLQSITRLNAQQVQKINIETADGSLQLRREDNRWYISSPFSWFANNIAAERIASLANVKYHSKLAKSEIDLSTLGLTIPKAVVTLNQTAVYFGSTNQIGNRRYLLVEPTVYLVDDIHFALINQGLGALIDKRLLPQGSGLSTLQSSEFDIVHEAGNWVSRSNLAQNERAQQLIKNWQTRQADLVEPYDLSLTPLKKITATLSNNTSIEFFVLSIQPEIILARPDIKLQFHFSDQLYYELLSLDQAPTQ